MNLPTTLGLVLLDSLLKPHIGPQNVKCYSIQILTKPGDNYGSTMLSLTVTLNDTTTKETQTLCLVAKLVPPVPLLSKLFNTPVTFSKEVDFYTLVVPAFRRLLSVSGGIRGTEMLDTYPQLYGSRLSANGDTLNADNDAILLLENLKVGGYQMCDRLLGLDLEHTEVTLTALARFHAFSIALRMHDPELFNSSVMKAARDWSTGMDLEDSYSKKWTTTALNTIHSIPECKQHVDKVQRFLAEEKDNVQVQNRSTKPFATLIHNDMWTNNIMFSYKDDQKTPCALKFIDFQLTTYDSPVRDIIFLLYTSTGEGVRTNNLEHFLKHYHASLINCLQELNCDMSNFSFERFVEEFNTHANLEFSRVLVILKVMCAETESLPCLLQFEGFDDILDGVNVGGIAYKRRVKELVLEFVQNGWI